MSLSKFNGKVVLSATNLADTSAGAKTSWNATFSFVDNSGVYLGSQVAVGDVIALDTGAADIGTITVYAITSIVTSTFNSFRVVMSYLTANANPGGAPDISVSVGLPGLVSRRSALKSLATLPNSSIQLLPEAFAVQVTNNNMFDVVDSLSSGTATAIAGGLAGQIHYQSAVGVTGFSAVGTAGQLFVSGGTGAPTWINTSSLSISSVSNVAGGVAGAVPYQSAVGVTGFSVAGTAGQFLTSGGTGAPTWTTPSAATVGTASKLAGGVAGAVVYQSAVGTTGFTAAGTAGQVLTSAGAGVPTWTTASTLTVSSASSATNLTGGVAGAVHYQSAVGVTGFSAAGTAGQVLVSGGAGAPTWINQASLSISSVVNVAGGVAGAVPYQSAVGVTGFTAAGTAGQILTSAGAGAPTWTTASTLTVSSATTATKLAGGVAGAVVYQSAVGTTGFTAAGTAGQILTSAGAGIPTWTTASTLVVSSAATATNLAGGVAGAVHYQSAANVTAFTAAGTTGQVLTSNGAAAPTWQAVATPAVTTQAYGDNTTNIATTAFVDRLRSSPTSTSTTAALADRGKTITSAVAITIPASVFAAGDCFSVYNNSAASITLTSGAGLTLWLVGTSTTGNRTLAQRGIATIYYVSATEAVITGGGLS